MSHDQFALTALSPLDGRYRSSLTEVSTLFSEFSLIKHRVLVEVQYLLFLAEHSVVPKLKLADKELLCQIYESFSIEDAEVIKAWENQTHHDIKAVEYWLRDQLQALKSPVAGMVHLGLTSEDTNSVSYGLMLTAARDQVVLPQLRRLLKQLAEFAEAQVAVPMLARTHGQAAVPTTLGKEWLNFAMRLLGELQHLESLKIEAKVTGAVGNFNASVVSLPAKDWPKLSAEFVSSLGLEPQLFTTQIAPAESYTRVFASLQRINLLLLDFNQDVWRYISDGYLVQTKKAGQVGSSTMPHKVNPIDFENSEGNLGLANALLQHLIVKLPVSRLQRDLSDSTVKRSIGTAIGYGHLAYTSLSKGLTKITVNQNKLVADLDDHWEILSEAIQVALRANGDTHGYEKLQQLSQGKVMSQQSYQDFVDSTQLPAAVKKRLRALTPATYIGLAPELTHQGLKLITKYLQGST